MFVISSLRKRWTPVDVLAVDVLAVDVLAVDVVAAEDKPVATVVENAAVVGVGIL